MADILDALAEAITIRDPHHRILYANQAAVRSMGFASLEDLQSQPPGEIFDEYEVVDERGQPLTMEDVPSVRLLAGLPADQLLMQITHRLTGERAWRLLKAAPLRGPEGTPVATVMIIEDVTHEKMTELRERFLASASELLMSSLDYEETLRHVAGLLVPELADWCAIDLVDDRGNRQQVAVTHRDPAKAELAAALTEARPRQVEAGGGIAQVLRTGVAELYPVVTEEMLADSTTDPHYKRLLQAVGMHSVIICPLRARGRTFGAITLVNAESRRSFEESDRAVAQEVAARAGVAVDNARMATTRRDIALTLQQSLLPARLPEIPGWEIAAMYRPGILDEVTEVGGDFYDFFATPSGWVVLLGDVTGKGMQAAAMTGLVRHGARFLSRANPEPAAIFAEVDLALREQGGLSLCTAVCARLQEDHALIGVAGHPAPLVIRDDGRLRELGLSGAILGAWSGGRWDAQRLPIGMEETLILYTDGVTDVPGAEGRFGLERLKRFLIEHAGASPAQLLAELEKALVAFQSPGQADDTAVLALRRTPVSGSAERGTSEMASPLPEASENGRGATQEGTR